MALRKKMSAKPMSAKAANDCPVCHTEHCNSKFGGMACYCPLFGVMTTKTFWLSAIAAVIVLFGFDMLWHGQLMMPHYLATAAMWRPEAEMSNYAMYCYVGHALTGMAYTALILLMGRTSTWWGGFITGVLAAAPMAIGHWMTYMFMPFADATIPQMWALGSLLQGGLVGLAVTAVAGCCCRKK